MPTPPAAVEVVIVHWNQLRGCLRTVEIFRGQTIPVRVVVVDNGSDPGTVSILRDRLPADVTLIELDRNLGFGPGANVGLSAWLSEGTAAWAAVVPHDALAEPDVLERMLAGVEDDVGMASADVGDGETPRIDPYLGPIGGPVEVTEGFEDADYAHGTLLMLRRSC